jgi:hypothetical protein
LETKLERTKLYSRKLLVCTLLIVLAFSAAATSMVHATSENNPPVSPNQASPSETAVATDENPTLIAIDDNSTIAPTDNSTLTRAQDNSTLTPDDNSTLYTAQDTQAGDNPPLIVPQSQPDNTVAILGVAVVVVIGGD